MKAIPGFGSLRQRGLLLGVCVCLLAGVIYVLLNQRDTEEGAAPTLPRGHQATVLDDPSRAHRQEEGDTSARSASSDAMPARTGMGQMQSECLPQQMEQVMEPLQEQLVKDLPSRVVNMKMRMVMDLEGFGDSTNSKVQELLSNYNKSRVGIRSLKLRGECTWLGGMSHEHKIEFVRDGFRVNQSCVPGDAKIGGGVAFYDDRWNEGIVDSYYLLGLAVFDPGKCRDVTATSIECRKDKNEPVSLSVWELKGKETTLYLGKDDNQLYRAVLKDEKGSTIQIDFTWASAASDKSFPTRTTVTIWGKDSIGTDSVPEKVIYLDVDPRNVESNIR